MANTKFKIIAGLGNPGNKYSQTRHNIGFSVIDFLADKFAPAIVKFRFDAEYIRHTIKGHPAFLIKPMTYMNRSGVSIHRFASYYKISIEDIIVVHDDMDFGFGKIKLVKSRGHGGHNGVRSIIETFGNKDCIRVRVGVGHSVQEKDGAGHVLGGFSPDEKTQLDQTIETASNACLAILESGISFAMNMFNSKK